MQIEAGKYYKTRDGQKVGPMVDFSSCGEPGSFIEVVGDGRWWSRDGIGNNEALNLDLIAEWTGPAEQPVAEPRGVAHFNPKNGDRFVCTWTECTWWTVGRVYVWRDGLTDDDGSGNNGANATFRRADPEPVATPAVSDRVVPLPAAVTFHDAEGYAVELSGIGDTVRLAVKYDADMIGYPLTPATALGLAHWLTVFADAADAGEGA